MPMREIRLAGATADAGIAALAQHAMAFLCDGGRVDKMVIDHRHEDEIGTAVAGRKRLCQSLAVDHVSDCRLTASLIQHLQRRIDADHLGGAKRLANSSEKRPVPQPRSMINDTAARSI